VTLSRAEGAVALDVGDDGHGFAVDRGQPGPLLHLYERLGVNDRAAAASEAYQRGQLT
jgi:hypothetical protein